jgi:hypothetical protein
MTRRCHETLRAAVVAPSGQVWVKSRTYFRALCFWLGGNTKELTRSLDRDSSALSSTPLLFVSNLSNSVAMKSNHCCFVIFPVLFMSISRSSCATSPGLSESESGPDLFEKGFP